MWADIKCWQHSEVWSGLWRHPQPRDVWHQSCPTVLTPHTCRAQSAYITNWIFFLLLVKVTQKCGLALFTMQQTLKPESLLHLSTAHSVHRVIMSNIDFELKDDLHFKCTVWRTHCALLCLPTALNVKTNSSQVKNYMALKSFLVQILTIKICQNQKDMMN